MDIKTVPIIFAVLSILILLTVMLRRRCLIKGLLSSAVQGIAALYAVKIIGLAIGTGISINWYTLGTAAVLGSPGVALMLAAQTIFNT